MKFRNCFLMVLVATTMGLVACSSGGGGSDSWEEAMPAKLNAKQEAQARDFTQSLGVATSALSDKMQASAPNLNTFRSGVASSYPELVQKMKEKMGGCNPTISTNIPGGAEAPEFDKSGTYFMRATMSGDACPAKASSQVDWTTVIEPAQKRGRADMKMSSSYAVTDEAFMKLNDVFAWSYAGNLSMAASQSSGFSFSGRLSGTISSQEYGNVKMVNRFEAGFNTSGNGRAKIVHSYQLPNFELKGAKYYTISGDGSESEKYVINGEVVTEAEYDLVFGAFDDHFQNISMGGE
jgi:hypothetical protein